MQSYRKKGPRHPADVEKREHVGREQGCWYKNHVCTSRAPKRVQRGVSRELQVEGLALASSFMHDRVTIETLAFGFKPVAGRRTSAATCRNKSTYVTFTIEVTPLSDMCYSQVL
jgi:hypothetical protein